MTIKEKILTFLDAEGIKKADFFEAVGIVPSNFKGAAKQSELGGDKIAKILSLYPRLSAEWLMRDNGEMIIETPITALPSDKILTNINTNPPDALSPVFDRLMSLISDKDTTVRSQAEEIGRLKERIAQLEREKNDSSASCQTAPRELSKSTVDL